MSQTNKSDCQKFGVLQRITSIPRVQRFMTRSKSFMGNILEKHNQGLLITKRNISNTMNEMGKFFSATEAKAVFDHSSNLFKEVNEELVASRIRLMSSTIRTVFEAQTRSILNRNNFSIENTPDDETEEQD